MGYEATVFPRVAAVAASACVGEPWESAGTPEASYMYQIRAAMNMEFYEPFSHEQKALNSYLTDCQAGLRLCDYAWRLFAQSLH